MTISGEDISRVTNLLKVRPRGMSIAAMAKELHLNRNSVAKYLDLLTASGAVEQTRVGPAKLYFTAPRVPVSGMINLSSDYFIMLDANLRVLYVNNHVLEFEERTRPEVLQKKLDDLSFALVADETIGKYLHSTERDEMFQREVEVQKGEETFHFRVKIISTVYENGSQGTTILASDITTETEQKKAIQEREENLRAVMTTAPAIILTVSREGKILYANRGAGEFSADGVIGRSLVDFVPPDQQDILRHHLEKTFTTGIPSTYEVRGYGPEGPGTAWYESHVGPVFQDGKITAATIISLNITERKKAREALQESEARFRAVVDSQQEGILRFNPDGIFTFVNDAFCRFVGRTPEQIVGVNVTHFVPAEDIARIREAYRTLTPEHSSAIVEFRAARSDGDLRWIQADFRAFFGNDGAIVEYQAVARDVTDLKAAERSIQESEARYRAVVEDQLEVIFRYRPDGIFTFANDAYCRFLGRPRDEIVGSNLIFPLPDEDIARIRKAYRSLTPSTPTIVLEHQATLSDGNIRWMQATIHALFDNQDTPNEYQVVARDVTDLKIAERRIQESEARYRAVVEDQTELICRFLPDGTHSFVNDAYCRYFGIQREDLIGHRFIPLIPEEDRKKVAVHLASLTRDHPVEAIEHRIVMPNGEVRWQRWIDRAIYTPEGSLVEYQSVGRDTTGRKRAEDLARTQFQSFPVPTYIWRKKGDDLVLSDFNDAALHITRGMIPGHQGRTARDMYLDRPDILANLERCLAEEITIDDEMPYTFQSTRETRDLLVRCAYLPPDGVLVYTLDMTGQKTMEKALRASEEQFREMAETSPFPISIIGGDGRYRYLNRRFIELFGYTLDDIPSGRRWFEQAFPDPEFRRKVMAAWMEDLAESRPGMVRPRQFPVRCRNGETCEIIFRPVTLRDGTQYITYEDVTERLRTNDSLRQSEARFRHLFNTMRCCFTLVEPVLDERGMPVDLTFLEVNSAMERLSGKIREDLLGQQLRELFPGTPREFIETIGAVALTGNPKKLAIYHPDFDRTLKIRAYSPWKGQSALIFRVEAPPGR